MLTPNRRNVLDDDRLTRRQLRSAKWLAVLALAGLLVALAWVRWG